MSGRRGLFFLLLLVGVFFSARLKPAFGQETGDTSPGLLVPFGQPSPGAYQELAARLFFQGGRNHENILILAIASASDPQEISAEERAQILEGASRQRSWVEQACTQQATTLTEPGSCLVSAAPIITRGDALDLTNLDYFIPDLSAIILLDGDPATAMQVIGGTPIEEALGRAYQDGAAVLASERSAALLSVAMLTGPSTGIRSTSTLDFGVAALWNSAERHGLIFGIPSAILEPQADLQGRLPLLINAIHMPGAPRLGVALFEASGIRVSDAKYLQADLRDDLLLIFDAGAYQSANTLQYTGNQNTLSLRNLLVHLVENGSLEYDLSGRRLLHLADSPQIPPSPALMRSLPQLLLPQNAGTLFLAGKLDLASGENAVLELFVQQTQSPSAPVLIIVDGFPSLPIAQGIALEYSGALDANAIIRLVDENAGFTQPLPAAEEFSAVLIVAEDQGKINLATYQDWLREAWLAGKPLMAVGGAAPLLGSVYAAHSLPSALDDSRGVSPESQRIHRPEALRNGLGLIEIAFEPGVLHESRWDWLFALNYARPDLISVGGNDNAALMITRDGGFVIGDSPLILLDARTAQRDAPEDKDTYLVNILLDIFTPGQPLILQNNLTQSSPAVPPVVSAVPPTPTITQLPVVMPQPTATAFPPTPAPTRTPRPTPTLLPLPPPSDPDTTQTMVIFGIFAVIVVLFGIFLNRRRVF